MIHDIPEGNIKDFLIHGVFVIILGAVLIRVHWSLSLLCLLLAIVLFRVRSGIEIDVEGRRARVYKTVMKWKLGIWKDLRHYSAIDLRYTNESQVMSSRGSSTNVTVRTYDMVFIGEGVKERMFHDFTDYAKARAAADVMVKNWTFTLVDEVQKIKQHARENAAFRRR